MKRIYSSFFFAIMLFLTQSAFSLTFELPSSQNQVVGQVQKVRAGLRDIVKITEQYDVGYYELTEANPGVDLDHLGPSTELTIPAQFILPMAPRRGVIVNLAELRMYYYPPKEKIVMTFPVGIGKQGRTTPLGKTTVTAKAVDPQWRATPEVREDFLRINGYPLPKVVMPGPDNPLGKYAVRLGFPTYLIHGTNDPSGVGKRASAGCIRMFNPDVAALFPFVERGSPVMIIYQPYIAGWSGNTLYFEAHQLAPDYKKIPDYKAVIRVALKQRGKKKVIVNWDLAAKMVQEGSGVPAVIGAA